PSRRREVEEEKRPAALLDRGDEIVEIAAHEQLAAGQVHPFELGPAIEEEPDLLGRHLVHTLFLPDIAHLAAEVAVIGRDERDLVRQLRRTHVGAENRATQANLAGQHHSTDRTIVPEASDPVNVLARRVLSSVTVLDLTRTQLLQPGPLL